MASSFRANDSLQKHDVFLSFCGADTRRGFTSYLYDALKDAGIQAYMDDQLEEGDEIEPSLEDAISESELSVVIFSENYASSKWCLNELVHILKCRKSQFVIPIFYNVEPRVVRHQSGSYEDAFVKHEKLFEVRELEAWRVALREAANISGFDSTTKKCTEAELVKHVVKHVLAKLKCKSTIEKGLEGQEIFIGIEKQVEEVEFRLRLGSDDVRIVGIWGMGGIGKSSIAEVVYERFSSQFQACCFIRNVRERSTTGVGKYKLRDQLLRTLLKEKDLRETLESIGESLKRRLSRKKVLVVLDDVNDLDQVKILTGGDRIWFGRGSRIVVTARDRRMLGFDDDMIYEVKGLDCDEALDLFHLRALRNLSPTTEYATLSREVVDYAAGNPLALTVLGSVFSHCRSREDWEGELEKLKKYPDKKIQNTLRLSYDALGENEKSIFLDIACFHKGKHIGTVERILKSCGFSANAGLRLLVDMSLRSVDGDSRVQMHDLIQEMGRKIVSDECDKNPGKRSRLWHADEVGPVLKKNKGTEAIECIVMNMDDLNRDLDVNAASFEKMDNLRLLDIHSTGGVNKVRLLPDFKFLPDALKYLRWDFYPQPSLPPKFSSENLVELHMSHSRLERLWHKDMQIELGSLKHIDLSWSTYLAELPDISESLNLEIVKLTGCSSLVQLPSLFQHTKLTHLYLENCSNLEILPEMPCNLEYLDIMMTNMGCDLYLCGVARVFMWGCKSVKFLPDVLPSKLKMLILDDCENLASLPVELPTGLLILSLDNCTSLTFLPVELPAGLLRLSLDNCTSLTLLPVELPAGLKELSLDNCTSLTFLPVELPAGLQELFLDNCTSLTFLPVELPAGLKELSLDNCTSLTFLPAELPAGLQELFLDNCTSLTFLPAELPAGLKELSLDNCTSLTFLPVELPAGLKELSLDNCTSLTFLPVELPAGLEELSLNQCENVGSLTIELPAGLLTLSLRGCKNVVSLLKLPLLLRRLDAHGCTSLETVTISMGSAQFPLQVSKEHDYTEPLKFDFSNCLKLDQTGKSNIMAVAQFRLFALEIGSDWEEQHNRGSYYIIDPVRVLCPGNEIPKWMRYQSEGCSINISLPLRWFREDFLGFALSIVFELHDVTPLQDLFDEDKNLFLSWSDRFRLVCQTCHQLNNVEVVCSQAITICEAIEHQAFPNSDHVLAWYLPLEEDAEEYEDLVEASFAFRLGYEKNYKMYPLDVSTVTIKRCGVSLVYDHGVETWDEDAVMEVGDHATSLKSEPVDRAAI